MIIKSLKVKGFKGFEKEFAVTFDEKQTIIEGENFKGKTSIGEAITWCLIGCNLFGNDKTANIINKNSVTASCELHFIDNAGEEHIVLRRKGAENIVILDGNKATNEILSRYYYGKKEFLSIFNPYYFSSLEPKEQRELLRSVLPNINYIDAFGLLSQSEQKILAEPRMDLNGFIKNSREELKSLVAEENNILGKIQYAKSNAVSHVGEEKTFENEGLLKALEIELETTLKSIPGDTKREMQSKIDELNEQIELYNSRLVKLRKAYKENQEILEKIKEDNSVCPVCKNKIIDETKEDIIKRQNEILEQIAREGKELDSELKKITAKKCMLDIKCNKLNPNEKKEELLSNIRDKIARLKLEKEDIQKNNYDVKKNREMVEKAISDISTFEKALDEVKSTRLVLNDQISVASTLNNLIIKKQMEMVKEHLDKVELVFFKVDTDTGEIKDDYKFLYDGKEFNVLSLSEKIRATLEVSNLINKILNLKIPTFIDNSESITHFNKEFDNQVILAKVVKSKELVVNIA